MARKTTKTSRIKVTPYDAAEYLDSPEAIAAYLEAAIEVAQEDGDGSAIAVALGNIARAKGVSDVAKEAGVDRGTLYKALSPTGDPRLSTLLGVFKALDIRLAVEPVE
jgi:probable addiction module antidote protein